MVLLTKLHGIAQTGKAYGHDIYDLERYEQLEEIYLELLRLLTDLPEETRIKLGNEDVGYATPKVDIRAVVFNKQGELLLVQEKRDQIWSLPGGWADIGYSPFEVAEKETQEEAGIRVSAQRLLAVKDKAKHAYPPSSTYVYKLFILCTALEETVHGGIETSAAKFFPETMLKSLEISLHRNTREDLHQLFKDKGDTVETYCD